MPDTVAPTQRLFIAFDLPAEIEAQLVTYQRSLEEELQGTSAVAYFEPASNLHITAAFLGEVQDQDAAVRALEALRGHASPFFTLGAYQEEIAPGIGWLTLDADAAAKQVVAALMVVLQETLGYVNPHPQWLAHLTMLRYRKGQAPGLTLQPPALSFVSPSISLFYSQRLPGGGGEYVPIHTVEFGTSDPTPPPQGEPQSTAAPAPQTLDPGHAAGSHVRGTVQGLPNPNGHVVAIPLAIEQGRRYNRCSNDAVRAAYYSSDTSLQDQHTPEDRDAHKDRKENQWRDWPLDVQDEVADVPPDEVEEGHDQDHREGEAQLHSEQLLPLDQRRGHLLGGRFDLPLQAQDLLEAGATPGVGRIIGREHRFALPTGEGVEGDRGHSEESIPVLDRLGPAGGHVGPMVEVEEIEDPKGGLATEVVNPQETGHISPRWTRVTDSVALDAADLTFEEHLEQPLPTAESAWTFQGDSRHVVADNGNNIGAVVDVADPLCVRVGGVLLPTSHATDAVEPVRAPVVAYHLEERLPVGERVLVGQGDGRLQPAGDGREQVLILASSAVADVGGTNGLDDGEERLRTAVNEDIVGDLVGDQLFSAAQATDAVEVGQDLCIDGAFEQGDGACEQLDQLGGRLTHSEQRPPTLGGHGIRGSDEEWSSIEPILLPRQVTPTTGVVQSQRVAGRGRTLERAADGTTGNAADLPQQALTLGAVGEHLEQSLPEAAVGLPEGNAGPKPAGNAGVVIPSRFVPQAASTGVRGSDSSSMVERGVLHENVLGLQRPVAAQAADHVVIEADSRAHLEESLPTTPVAFTDGNEGSKPTGNAGEVIAAGHVASATSTDVTSLDSQSGPGWHIVNNFSGLQHRVTGQAADGVDVGDLCVQDRRLSEWSVQNAVSKEGGKAGLIAVGIAETIDELTDDDGGGESCLTVKTGADDVRSRVADVGSGEEHRDVGAEPEIAAFDGVDVSKSSQWSEGGDASGLGKRKSYGLHLPTLPGGGSTPSIAETQASASTPITQGQAPTRRTNTLAPSIPVPPVYEQGGRSGARMDSEKALAPAPVSVEGNRSGSSMGITTEQSVAPVPLIPESIPFLNGGVDLGLHEVVDGHERGGHGSSIDPASSQVSEDPTTTTANHTDNYQGEEVHSPEPIPLGNGGSDPRLSEWAIVQPDKGQTTDTGGGGTGHPLMVIDTVHSPTLTLGNEQGVSFIDGEGDTYELDIADVDSSHRSPSTQLGTGVHKVPPTDLSIKGTPADTAFTHSRLAQSSGRSLHGWRLLSALTVGDHVLLPKDMWKDWHPVGVIEQAWGITVQVRGRSLDPNVEDQVLWFTRSELTQIEEPQLDLLSEDSTVSANSAWIFSTRTAALQVGDYVLLPPDMWDYHQPTAVVVSVGADAYDARVRVRNLDGDGQQGHHYDGWFTQAELTKIEQPQLPLFESAEELQEGDHVLIQEDMWDRWEPIGVVLRAPARHLNYGIQVRLHSLDPEGAGYRYRDYWFNRKNLTRVDEPQLPLPFESKTAAEKFQVGDYVLLPSSESDQSRDRPLLRYWMKRYDRVGVVEVVQFENPSVVTVRMQALDGTDDITAYFLPEELTKIDEPQLNLLSSWKQSFHEGDHVLLPKRLWKSYGQTGTLTRRDFPDDKAWPIPVRRKDGKERILYLSEHDLTLIDEPQLPLFEGAVDAELRKGDHVLVLLYPSKPPAIIEYVEEVTENRYPAVPLYWCQMQDGSTKVFHAGQLFKIEEPQLNLLWDSERYKHLSAAQEFGANLPPDFDYDEWDDPKALIDLVNPPGMPRPIYKGLPVPWTAMILMPFDDGHEKSTIEPDFRKVDERRHHETFEKGLCTLCGEPLTDPVFAYFSVVGGAQGLIDGPLHQRCAVFTGTWCPHIEGQVNSGHLRLEQVDLAVWNAHRPLGEAQVNNFRNEWMKVGQVKQAMPADPAFIQQWIAEHGPYLYHGAGPRASGDFCTGPEMIESILQRGITPAGDNRWNDELPKAEEYSWEGYGDGALPDDYEADAYEWWLRPRPGHVWLVADPKDAYGVALFQVDLRLLDPSKLNADEDFWRDHGIESGEWPMGHSFSPEDNPFGATTWEELRPHMKTLGEQAEAIGLGDNPLDTQYSLEHGHSSVGGILAYRGTIPPTAIKLIAQRPNARQEWQTVAHSTWKLAMPYEDNVWYHVTDRSRLSQIAQQGLAGAEQGHERAWAEYPIDASAVYLWPLAAAANQYHEGMADNANPRYPNPVVLRIHGLSQNQLAPDQEHMANYLEGLEDRLKDHIEGEDDIDVEELEVHKWIERYERQHLPPENTALTPTRDFVEFHIEMLRAMPPAMREYIARHISEYNGDPVMHYGTIPPEKIEVGELHEYPENTEYYYDDPTDDSFADSYQWTPLTQYRSSAKQAFEAAYGGSFLLGGGPATGATHVEDRLSDWLGAGTGDTAALAEEAVGDMRVNGLVIGQCPVPHQGELEQGRVNHPSKSSMAERTGDLELDGLIESYLNRGRYFYDPAEGHATGYDDEAFHFPLDEMRHEHNAVDMCDVLSADFSRFAVDNGFNAYMYDNPERSHCTVRVEHNGQTFDVDWTAAQFGEREFPMIKRAMEEQTGNECPRGLRASEGAHPEAAPVA